MRSLSTRTTGLFIVALGVWGGLIPFVGPYFHFVLGPDKSWHWTTDRLYLDVLPGLVAVIGGLMLIGAGPRPSARLGALLAILSGIWFAIGPDVSLLWNSGGAQGAAHGSKGIRVLELVAFHTGLGAVVAALGGYALPRFVRGAALAAAPAATETAAAGTAAAGTAAAGTAAGESPPARPTSEPVAARDEVPAGGAAAAPVAGESEYAKTPAERDATYADSPAAERGSGYANDDAAVPNAGTQRAPEAPAQAAGEPIASQTNPPVIDGDGATAADAEPAGGGYAGSTHVARRRRGGLLSGLFSRR